MKIQLSDLCLKEIRALIRLDDGFPPEDSVGQIVDATPQALLPATIALCVMELAEIVEGWRGLQWFRLTAAGRRLRETGSDGRY